MEYQDEEEFTSKVKVTKGTWTKIFKVMTRNRKLVILLFVLVLCVVGTDLANPLINQYSIHTFFESNDPARFDKLPTIMVIYFSMAIFTVIVTFGFISVATKLEAYTAYELRKEAYEKLQRLSFSYFDTTQQGWIMARMTSDSRNLSEILSWGLFDILWGGLTMIGILIVLMIANFQLSLIIVGLGVVLFTLTIFFRKVMLKNYRLVRKINSSITAAYNEGFMGANTSKSLVIEEDNKRDFKSKSMHYKRKALTAAVFSGFFGPVVFFLGYIGVGGILYSGGIQVLNNAIQVSVLYLFVQNTIRFFDPILTVTRVIGDFQQAGASAERIISLIEEPIDIIDTPEVIEKYGTTLSPKTDNFEKIRGDIEFKNVSFKYKVGNMVLDNFNLSIKAGQTIGLVGHTGSGKSTIINLVCRFYEPTLGEIIIDGKNYKERSKNWLHSNIGYVLQSPQLFSGTIKDNIKYGKLDATDEEIIAAAKLVRADEFIDPLPLGYDTEIGEGGSKLSQGERQLISFARAIIGDPSILVLDEATSSIDTKTESLIQSAIDKVLNGRTSFIVAHRLSTVVNADQIIVLDHGIILEKGTHSELLAKEGVYYDLYRNQFINEHAEKLENSEN